MRPYDSHVHAVELTLPVDLRIILLRLFCRLSGEVGTERQISDLRAVASALDNNPVDHRYSSDTSGPPGTRTLNPRIKSPLLCH